MAHILITSGPTREYLDPVRYMSNASSGRMGACLAQSALDAGHQVTVISGPVQVTYPESANVISVTTTEEMLVAATEHFPNCDGIIAAAAPCDFKPVDFSDSKIKKTPGSDGEVVIKFVETPDILAAIGASKQPLQWSIGFALETDNGHQHAIEKLRRKQCDLIVLNGASAINSLNNQIDIINREGRIIVSMAGPKQQIADAILASIPGDSDDSAAR